MKHIKFSGLCFLALLLFTTAQAQVKTQKKETAKAKMPVLITTLGAYKDSMILPADEIKKIIGDSVKVYDINGNQFKVTYYQFVYKRKEFNEDEKTGKAIPVNTMVADYFTSTPLPKIWTNTIKDELKSGEEVYFFDIIAKSKSGDVYYAPNLKLIVR